MGEQVEKKSMEEQEDVRRSDLLSFSMADMHQHMLPSSSPPVFVIDESFFRARTPPSMHWSIAWSDLMMTMFILFLTLFIYQVAHREFLSEEEYPEIVAGSAMDIPVTPPSTLPFYPIYPELSGKKGDIIKKTETVPMGDPAERPDGTAQVPVVPPEATDTVDEMFAQNIVISKLDILESTEIVPQPSPDAIVRQPPAPVQQKELFSEMYDLSKYTLASEKLEKFASVDLVPDKTLRIILTGDLLFASGQAELNKEARTSLAKLVPVIRQAPHLINVIGHTDSIPMHSEQYASNWELSTARASRVARFLIEEGGIPAGQFVVSGYSYLRPIKPNTTENNRRINRRVEIILTKEPAPAETAPINTFLESQP